MVFANNGSLIGFANNSSSLGFVNNGSLIGFASNDSLIGFSLKLIEGPLLAKTKSGKIILKHGQHKCKSKISRYMKNIRYIYETKPLTKHALVKQNLSHNLYLVC